MAEEREWISLVATRTVDLIPVDGGPPREVPGGPAVYVARALESLGYPFRLITGDVPRVRVIPLADGERYVIPAIPAIPLPSRISGRAVMLSPVIGEIDPNAIPPCDGIIVIDLQGFVRQPGVPTDQAAGPFDLAALIARAAIVKANRAELQLLSEKSREALRGAIVLETLGRLGARVFHDGAECFIPSVPVDVQNTIGAGDTFLTAFTVATLRGHVPAQAAQEAARFTEAMLRSRLRP